MIAVPADMSTPASTQRLQKPCNRLASSSPASPRRVVQSVMPAMSASFIVFLADLSCTGCDGDGVRSTQSIAVRAEAVGLLRVRRDVERSARLGIVDAEDAHGEQAGLFRVDIEVGVGA